jgi:acetyl esterase/lipase
METIELEISGFYHQASLHRAMSNRVNKTIVYYHGGGFIFGSRDDLPAYAIEKLTNAGYDFVCMDYPKAPEMSLSQICDFVENQLIWLQENYKKMDLSEDYILFGRSAGGFLVLYLAKRMAMMNRKMPDKLIVFYGYESLVESEFTLPSDHYLNYPHLRWDDVMSVIDKKPVFTTNLLKRYPLYIYARQTGRWLQLLGIDEVSKTDVNLEANISSFPAIFFAASYYDNDVSYHNSLIMSQKYDNTILFTSWQNKHEFDQIQSAESTKLYESLLHWL